VLQVAEGIRKLVGDQVRIEHGPERPGDFGGKEISGAKAQRELDWAPKVPFTTGLKSTVEWFREKWGR